MFVPIAFENLGVPSECTRHLLAKLGMRLTKSSSDSRETDYLFQRCSVLIQHFNAVLLHDCFPTCDRTEWHAHLYIYQQFFCKNPSGSYGTEGKKIIIRTITFMVLSSWQATSRVHLVHMMSTERRQAAADPCWAQSERYCINSSTLQTRRQPLQSYHLLSVNESNDFFFYDAASLKTGLNDFFSIFWPNLYIWIVDDASLSATKNY